MVLNEDIHGLILGIQERILEIQQRLSNNDGDEVLTDLDGYGIIEQSEDGWEEVSDSDESNWRSDALGSLRAIELELERLSDSVELMGD